MNVILAALATFVQPAINYAEQKLASIGAAFLGSLAVIGNAFTNDQRAIAVNVTAFWQAHYHAAVTAGTAEVAAIEQASTAALNEFCAVEGAELNKVAQLIISALEIAITNGLST